MRNQYRFCLFLRTAVACSLLHPARRRAPGEGDNKVFGKSFAWLLPVRPQRLVFLFARVLRAIVNARNRESFLLSSRFSDTLGTCSPCYAYSICLCCLVYMCKSYDTFMIVYIYSVIIYLWNKLNHYVLINLTFTWFQLTLSVFRPCMSSSNFL